MFLVIAPSWNRNACGYPTFTAQKYERIDLTPKHHNWDATVRHYLYHQPAIN
jgi:hypothetical protein